MSEPKVHLYIGWNEEWFGEISDRAICGYYSACGFNIRSNPEKVTCKHCLAILKKQQNNKTRNDAVKG